jgi:hypothetical protein
MCSLLPPETSQDGHIYDAPILRPSLAEMDDLRMYLARASPLAAQYGGVRIDPPEGWTPPPLTLCDHSRFFVRVQSLPAAPVPHRRTGDARIRESVIFPDSRKPVTLARYRTKANQFHAWLCQEIFAGAFTGDGGSSTKLLTRGISIYRSYGSKTTTKSSGQRRSRSSSSYTSVSEGSSRNKFLLPRKRAKPRGRSTPSSTRCEHIQDKGVILCNGDEKRGIRGAPNGAFSSIGREMSKMDTADDRGRNSFGEVNIDDNGSPIESRYCPSSTEVHFTNPRTTSLTRIPADTSRSCARLSCDDCLPRGFTDRASSQSRSDSVDTPIRQECLEPPSRGASLCSAELPPVRACPEQLPNVRTNVSTASDPTEFHTKSRSKRPRGNLQAARRSAESSAVPDSHNLLDSVPTDFIEEEFWHIFSNGVNGHEVDLAYGVDVEAEGPFNVLGKAYVNSGDGCCKKFGQGGTARDFAAGPRWHVGNINTAGVLRHLPRMPGINHSMYYIGQLFTRFCWHTEDAFLNALSYLHSPSANKVWYVVPTNSASALEAYAVQEVFAPEMQVRGASGHSLLMAKTTMFDPRDVRRSGIPVYKIVQKPGTFVFTAPRAYHCGFNCGFNIAEAVNFAMPNWLPYGQQASVLARACGRPLCIPREFVIFREAMSLREASASERHLPKLSNLVQMIRDAGTPTDVSCPYADEQDTLRMSDATYLATELLILIDEGERAISEFVEKASCLISEGNASMSADLRGAPDFYPTHCSDLGQAFGSGAGMLCCICGHSSHFYSAICGTCLDGGETARCPQHFLAGGPICSIPGHRPMVIRRHSPVLLLDLLSACEEIAGIQVEPSAIVKRNTSYIRYWATRSTPSPDLKSRAPAYLRLYPPKSYVAERTSTPARTERPRGQSAKTFESLSPAWSSGSRCRDNRNAACVTALSGHKKVKRSDRSHARGRHRGHRTEAFTMKAT